MELSRKEENSLTKVRERTKPTLVTVGNKQIISSGRWNDELMAEYVLVNGRSKWLTIGELAKVAYGQNMPRTKERVRRCLYKLFSYMLHRNKELLSIECGPRNRAMAVKVFSQHSEQDRQNLVVKLERMRKRRELTSDQYEQALIVLESKNDLVPPPTL